MKRRTVLAAGAGAAATTLATPAISQGRIQWRMVTSWPRGFPGLGVGAERIARRIGEMSGGRFTVQVFAAGQLVPPLGVFDAVTQGGAEMMHTAAYYWQNRNRGLNFFTGVPMGMTSKELRAWIRNMGGQEIWDEIYAQFNLKGFMAADTGVQAAGWFRREINTVADLQGLKMRIPGLGAQVLGRLGVVTQTLPGGEIFQALSTGAIDAAEWVGAYDDEKLGLPDAAEFYYSPGWWEPGPSLHAVFNLDAWNKLPKEYQNFLRVACWEANMNMLAKYDALNNDALERIVAKGKKLRVYSDEILNAAQKTAFELFAESEAKSAAFKEIFPGWNSFRQKIQRWHQTNELPFNLFVKNNPI